MAYKLGNRVKMTVSGTPGTGTITLGSAVPGFNDFASALSSGDTCPYVIEDTSNAWEIGVGTYTSSGTTLARTTVVASSAGGTTKISATSAAQVYLAPLATDLNAGTITGILKSSGAGVFSAAAAGTDYVAPGGSAGAITATGLKETKTAPSISSGTLTLDCSAGNVFAVSLNANITTLSFTNVPSTGTAYGLTLALTADGTARTVTWGSAVKWPAGTAPTLTSTNAKVDTFVLYTHDGGTTWYAFTAGQNA